MTSLLIATFNQGKAGEIRSLLAPLDLQTLTLSDCGIGDPYDERGSSYEENARGKALHYAARARRIALADDSGLEVAALGGAPGLLSARYGGPGLNDASRNRLLLESLSGVPDGRRDARYVAVVAIARPDGAVRLFRGECAGVIASAPRGAGGFGYDPIFYYPPLHATFAEIPADRKNAVSHRGAALRAVAAFLPSAEGRAVVTAGP